MAESCRHCGNTDTRPEDRHCSECGVGPAGTVPAWQEQWVYDPATKRTYPKPPARSPLVYGKGVVAATATGAVVIPPKVPRTHSVEVTHG